MNLRTKYKCPFCEIEGVRISGVTDCSIDIYCPFCKESGTVEPDGLGEGGLEWVEAMEAFS